MITAGDKRLLLRVARRLEENALQDYDNADDSTPAAQEAAKRRRDHELGDVRDVKDYVKREEALLKSG